MSVKKVVVECVFNGIDLKYYRYKKIVNGNKQIKLLLPKARVIDKKIVYFYKDIIKIIHYDKNDVIDMIDILKNDRSIRKNIDYFDKSNKIYRIYFTKYSPNNFNDKLNIRDYLGLVNYYFEGRLLEYDIYGCKIKEEYYIDGRLNGYQTIYNKYGQNYIRYHVGSREIYYKFG